ncbi:nucleic acid-binding protein [Wallemia mellicola]|nr:nucleic acid-binding protein [Wallemia mellicola]TIB90820.1 nucleic acid-binding protein [Wallemia mellicola]TIC36329.1 nucleic acid-binding protein [Wallemia mellicola]TIC42656.1 nucleic acid-binding protein [Wallemia mellicola]TIC51390.1 nucleic acid-binding protein [Wallemia mellicola]
MDLAQFEKEIATKTFLKGQLYSSDDLEMYKNLHSAIAPLQATQLHAFPNTVRYFSLIQKLEPARKLGLEQLTFDYSTFPKPVRVADAPKEKKPKKDAAPVNKEAPAGTSKAGAEGAAAKKEGKKDKSKKEKAPPAPPAPVLPPSPSMIDLRVGKIVKVEKHPDADSLYVEQIDLGTETRTVVSGLVKYVPIEEMQDKMVVAICNLKPASMRGIKSFAMVLCATSSDGKDGGVEFVNPPEGSAPGDRIFFEGYEDTKPEEQLNPKKKVFETIQPGFRTLDTLEACWINPETSKPHLIKTSKDKINQGTIEDLVLEGGNCYTDISGSPGVGRTSIITSSLIKFLSLAENANAYAIIIDVNGDLNLRGIDDEITSRIKYVRTLNLSSFLVTIAALPAYIESSPFTTKVVAIDTISNYMRNPDITQKHKISIQNTIRSSFNKLTNDMSVKIISTSDAVIRRTHTIDDNSVRIANLGLENNNYMGPFHASNFNQMANFRQLQLSYEPGEPKSRKARIIGTDPEVCMTFSIGEDIIKQEGQHIL